MSVSTSSENDTNMDVGKSSISWLLTIALLVLVMLILAYYLLDQLGLISIITDAMQLHEAIGSAEGYGVPLIIGLMTIAIVLNPIPSAPIALVAGALYGHTWGTVYIIIGAQAGAMIAFLIARFGGRNLVVRLLGKHRVPQWAGSQNSLTIFVFLSRLMPFISFDLVSYAAGLTSLRFWRFSMATLIGLLPASFLLAHFGSEVSTAELDEIMMYALLFGLVVLLPVLLGLLNLLKRSHFLKTYE